MSKKPISTFCAGALLLFAATTVGNAACIESVWTKDNGNSLADVIRGRDCNGNLSVKFSGSLGDTGWVEMRRGNLNYLHATYVDNIITTKVTMKPVGTSMWTFFKHEETSGTISATQGKYSLQSLQ